MPWFLAVGLVALAIDLITFNVLVGTRLETFAASFISILIANIFVFFGNLFLSFRHVRGILRLPAAVKFGVLAIATILVNNLLVWLGLAVFGSGDLVIANLVKLAAVAFLVVLRFLAMKYLIYIPVR